MAVFGSIQGQGHRNTRSEFSQASDAWPKPPDVCAALDAEFEFEVDVAATPRSGPRPTMGPIIRSYAGLIVRLRSRGKMSLVTVLERAPNR
jgi:hypothetical protein